MSKRDPPSDPMEEQKRRASTDLKHIISFQEDEIEKHQEKLEELELLLEAVNNGSLGNSVNIKNRDGFYNLTIHTKELSSEIHDTLGFTIIGQSEIEKQGEGVKITAKLKFDPQTVSTILYN